MSWPQLPSTRGTGMQFRIISIRILLQF